MSEALIKIEGVSKKFCRNLKRSLWYGMKDISREITGGCHEGNEELRPGEFWAVKDVSFELKRGECLGLIGHNGAGKTTLLKMLNGLIKPDVGRIEMRGRTGALIALGAGFNPILTGRENVYVNGAVLGLTKKEVEAKFDEIVEFAELWDFIDTPVQSYSSGMQVRLGFAVATATNPDILLLDEVLAVGDRGFRSKCLQRIGQVLSQTAVIFVSHDTVQISRICDKVILLDHGRVDYHGDPNSALDRYIPSTMKDRQSSIVTDPRIVRFECKPVVGGVRYNGSCLVTLILTANEMIKTGLCLLNLSSQDDQLHAQADFSHGLTEIANGTTTATFNLGRLQLRADVYKINITILDSTRKVTLVHAIACQLLKLTGPRGYGVSHQVPMTLNSLSVSQDLYQRVR